MVEEEPSPSSARGRVVASLRELRASSVELRRELHDNERAMQMMMDGLVAGVPLGDLLDAVNSERIRPQLTGSLQCFERRRREARLRMIAVGLEQGMSVEDIQKRWAITRSLAVRNIREAKGLGA